ncbi:MAG: protein kinase [Proteobacteria bacterium]|nr:protein kinase [Pseudomonadota bacterium]
MRRSHIATLLSRFQGFEALDRDELTELAGQVIVGEWKARQKIVSRGEVGGSMLLLASGEVEAHLQHHATGGVRPVVIREGEVFGEIGMLSGKPRSADIIATKKCVTLELRREDVEPLLWRHPQLARFITALVQKRLAETGSLHQVGKYRLLRSIGRGSSSEVFEGIHEGLDRPVAVKMLSHTLLYDRTFRDRFLLEAHTIAQLDHPNIVRVYDSESAYATWFIVMERLEGSDLRTILHQRKRLAAEEVQSLLWQAADALRYAHGSGVVHRDIKPANCSVDDRGRLKLVDFGLAAKMSDAGEERTDSVLGTPFYIAPEMARGRPASPASDVYALGVMGYEMLVGAPPFRGGAYDVLDQHVNAMPPDVREASPSEVPTGLASFINRALAKDPAARPTMAEVQDRLLARPTSQPVWGRGTKGYRSLVLEYPAEAAARVDQLVDLLAKRVSEVPGARVLGADLRPCDPPAPGEPAKVPATRELKRKA